MQSSAMEKGGKASLCLKFTFLILQVLFLVSFASALV